MLRFVHCLVASAFWGGTVSCGGLTESSGDPVGTAGSDDENLGDGATVDGGHAGGSAADGQGGNPGVPAVPEDCACDASNPEFQQVSLRCYCEHFDCPSSLEEAAEKAFYCDGDSLAEISAGCGLLVLTSQTPFHASQHVYDSDSGALIAASLQNDLPTAPCDKFGYWAVADPDRGITEPNERTNLGLACDSLEACTPCEDDARGRDLAPCE